MIKDLKNKRFGKLFVIEYNGNGKWLCQCDCGNKTIVRSDYLKTGHTKSCGCIHKKYGGNIRMDRLYRLYRSIIQRTTTLRKDNHNRTYINKNIKMCEEWRNDFNKFKEWALANGYEDNLTIDRIDNNGNYEPNNCRWVNNKTQSNNRTDNCFITYLGETLTISQWGDKLGIDPKTIRARYKVYNLPLEKVFYKGDLRYGTKRK